MSFIINACSLLNLSFYILESFIAIANVRSFVNAPFKILYFYFKKIFSILSLIFLSMHLVITNVLSYIGNKALPVSFKIIIYLSWQTSLVICYLVFLIKFL